MKRAALITAGLLLASCGVSEIDTELVEDEIRKGVKEQRGLDVTVDCPETVKIEVGKTFQCTVEDPETGEQVDADVTMDTEDGDITWKIN